jgi:hypothetical protein
MDDNSVLLAKPGLLTEANYERVKDKIENQMVPFVMISAFRGSYSRNENLRRQKQLENYVKGAKFPWTKMPGSGYVEEPEIGEPERDEEAEEDNQQLAEMALDDEQPRESTPDSEEELTGTEVKENSILIWDETRPDMGPRGKKDTTLFELAKFLAKKYDQDSFIYGEPVQSKRTGQSRMEALPYDKNGDELDWGVTWRSLEKISDDDLYWSSIGGHKAKLVELLNKYQKMPVKSRLDAMKKQHYLHAVKSALKRF